MRGFVNFVENHFGFLVFASNPNSEVLDSDVFFRPSDTGGYALERGQMVDFEIGNDDQGRRFAFDIRPAEESRFCGTIISIRNRSGVIEADGRFNDDQRIPFVVNDFVPDAIGRRCAAGMRVSFATKIKVGREFAVRIRNEDPALQSIDPATYVEVGQVIKINGVRATIERPLGTGLIPFFTDALEHPDLIEVGTWVDYRVQIRLNIWDKVGRHFWHQIFATDVQPYMMAPAPGSFEDEFLNAPELPLSESQPEELEPGHVYLASERKLSLRELIARKHAA